MQRRMHLGLGMSPLGGAVSPFVSAVYDLDFFNQVYSQTLSDLISEQASFTASYYEDEATGDLFTLDDSDLQIGANGLEVWPFRAHPVYHNRDMTQAAWTKTNCSAARSTGRTGVSNSGSRITVEADGATALVTQHTAASRTWIGSVDIRRVSGSGGVEMTVDGGSSWVDLEGITTAWQRLSIAPQALADPQAGFRFETDGDVFDIDFVTCEGGTSGTVISFAGPRVQNATAGNIQKFQNRASTFGKAPLNDLIKTNTYAFYWEGKMDAGGGRGVFISDGGFTFSVNASGQLGIGGTTTPEGSFTFGEYQKIACYKAGNGAGATRFSLNGGEVLTGTIADNAGMTHFDISTNNAGSFNIGGVVRRVAFWDAPLSDAELQAATAL
jgi:hypothetical protein